MEAEAKVGVGWVSPAEFLSPQDSSSGFSLGCAGVQRCTQGQGCLGVTGAVCAGICGDMRRQDQTQGATLQPYGLPLQEPTDYSLTFSRPERWCESESTCLV